MADHSQLSSRLGRFNSSRIWLKQRGAALILMAYILGIGAAVYILKTYNTDQARAKQDEKTYQSLRLAKNALISWAVNYSSAPGQMPWPDRNGDGNYEWK